ncbi:hypothetical protein BOTCAL_0002g00640 [Botryotinia calthae]|uniref:BTB domain-containing protein n=1 Tax=Botryotinia calthae TaxID=38488 RepID=A0A4Y8DI63_9HELO|nr:hypothetical protein BOTCAL_0002g00640 [Botryotinia calthae]
MKLRLTIPRGIILIKVNGGCCKIHKELLADSRFFKDLGYFQTFKLDEECETIDYFVQWLYTPGHFVKVPEIKTVLRLCTFADTIGFPKLQNYSMDFTQDHYLRNAKFMGLDELKYVFEATGAAHMEDSPLREFCVAQLHFQNNNDDISAVIRFLQTFPIAINAYLEYEAETCCDMDRNHDPRSRERFPCEFHVHVPGSKRNACQIKLE